MRLVIAFVLFVICAYIGCSKPSALKRRIGIIEGLERDIRRLSMLMEHRRQPITELMRELDSPLWRDVRARLSRSGISCREAWNEALTDMVESGGWGCLGKQELVILTDFGGALGAGDINTQLDNAALAVKRLEEQRDLAAAEMGKKARVYRSLGILGGAAAALMVI